MQQATAAGLRLPIEGELPSLGSVTGWVNPQPLRAAALRGKSFSSTSARIPASTGYARFRMLAHGPRNTGNGGSVVIGVHTPEFPSEKDIENVRRALKDNLTAEAHQ